VNSVPLVFAIREIIFCIVFVTELAIRVAKHTTRFYRISDALKLVGRLSISPSHGQPRIGIMVAKSWENL